MRTEIIKCDRCGKELNNESAYKINLPYMGEVYIYRSKVICKDLCEQCMEELVDWMNGVER